MCGNQMRQPLFRRQLRVGPGKLAGNISGRNRNLHVGVKNVVLELFSPVHRVDRHHDCIGAQDGEVRDDPLRRVLHVEHYPVALFDAHACQRSGQPLCLPHHFSIGQHTVKKHQRGFVRETQRIDGQVMPKGGSGRVNRVWQPFGPKFEVGAVHKISCSSLARQWPKGIGEDTSGVAFASHGSRARRNTRQARAEAASLFIMSAQPKKNRRHAC